MAAAADSSRAQAKGYLNRFRHQYSMPQATIASTAEPGSGTLATRKPKPLSSFAGLVSTRSDDRKELDMLAHEPPRMPLNEPPITASSHSKTLPP